MNNLQTLTYVSQTLHDTMTWAGVGVGGRTHLCQHSPKVRTKTGSEDVGCFSSRLGE